MNRIFFFEIEMHLSRLQNTYFTLMNLKHSESLDENIQTPFFVCTCTTYNKDRENIDQCRVEMKFMSILITCISFNQPLN